MSTARNDKVKVDVNKLQKLLGQKGISRGDASKKAGHDRSWLSQRMKNKEKFDILGSDAELLATALSCGIQQFKADEEETRSALGFDYSLLKEKIDKIPSDLFPFVNRFLNFIVEANDQQIVDIHNFLEREQSQIEPHCTVDPKHWFQEYLLTETSDTFYKGLTWSLAQRQIVKSEADLRELVLSEYSKAKPNVNKAIERIHIRLRKDIPELEDVMDNALNAILFSSAKFLVSYFIGNDTKVVHQVTAIKERLRNSTDAVPRSDVP